MTYRLQLHGGFTLEAARELVPYLAALGVTDCYCSPVFRAAPGSTHGYDVSRHTEINPELGGKPAFAAFEVRLFGARSVAVQQQRALGGWSPPRAGRLQTQPHQRNGDESEQRHDDKRPLHWPGSKPP